MYGFNTVRGGRIAAKPRYPWSISLLSIVKIWVMRARGRRELRRLLDDPHLLADIGVSRSAAEIEAERAFWDRAGR